MMSNVGIAPPDFTTPVGQVRLLIQDTDATEITFGKGTFLFASDDEITAMIGLTGGSVNKTAVRYLRMIAGSQALKLKKFTSADLAVDGPAITDALLAAAKAIEEADLAGDLMNLATLSVPTGGISWDAVRARRSDAYPQYEPWGVYQELKRYSDGTVIP